MVGVGGGGWWVVVVGGGWVPRGTLDLGLILTIGGGGAWGQWVGGWVGGLVGWLVGWWVGGGGSLDLSLIYPQQRINYTGDHGPAYLTVAWYLGCQK